MEVICLDGVRGPYVKRKYPSKNFAIPAELVKAMLGGEWPEDVPGYEGFCFDAVEVYHLEDGFLVPYDGLGGIIPGPDFKISPVPGPEWGGYLEDADTQVPKV
jgi:hypothetical protein